MRAKKPSKASADACQRCTAILLSGVQRCTMCGWPSGAGYPPGDDQQVAPLVAVPTSVPAEVVDEGEGHADAQFDALTALAERRTAPAVVPEAVEAELAAADIVNAVDVDLEDEGEVDTDPATDIETVEAPALVMAAATSTTADFDPLTAPLEQLMGGSAPRSGGLSDAPPADSVDHDGHVTAHEPTEAVASAISDIEPVPPAVAADHQVSHDAAIALAPLTRPASALIVTVPVLSLLTLLVSWLAGRSLEGSVTSAGLLGLVGLTLAMGTLAAWAASIVVFLLWVRRARANVADLSPVSQRWSPTWSVVGWLVPVAGLFIGWQVLVDLWHGSDPQSRDDAGSTRPNPQPIIGWLVGLALSFLVSSLTGPVLPDSLVLDLLSVLLLLGSGVCLAIVVRQIGMWQDTALPVAATDAVGTSLEA